MKILQSLFGEDKNCKKLCVRRVAGMLGFIACIVALFIPSINADQYVHFLYISAALLGLTTIDKFIEKPEE